MPGFAQSLEVPEKAKSPLREEELVVGAAAKMGKEKVPDGLDAIPDLVLRGKPKHRNELPHGIHPFTSFDPVF
jgi:hypothetical protein